MSKLKNVKEFIQQVADAFAAVLDYEICVVDDELEVLVSTGKYEKEIIKRGGPGCITHQLMVNPDYNDVIVKDTKSSTLCEKCTDFKGCPVQATTACSIIFSDQTLGAFCLMAVDQQQRRNFINNDSNLMTLSQKVANFIASTLGEKIAKSQIEVMADRFKAVINSVHEGIITIDDVGEITHINQSAKEILSIEPSQKGEHINTLFPQFDLSEVFDNVIGNNYFEKKVEFKQNNKRLILLCNITLIKSDNKVAGATISFRKLDEMKKLANKIIAEDKKSAFDEIKGVSSEIVNLKEQMRKVVQTDSTILLRGESGTGKSMFARAIHEESGRSDGSFISVNCGAIPESLLESELFGYEEGAFTGAKKGGKPGKFELADQGTIFLDEIGDMPPQFQIKLLKVIETKRMERVGGVEPIDIDVRIIAATHRDLEKMVEEGKFRKDLFYRLNVIPFHIPSLRERTDDIILLSHFFLEKYSNLLNKKIESFTKKAKERLLNYSWPGNVRELENCIEYAVNIEGSNYITENSLPKRIMQHQLQIKETSRIPTMKEVEKKTIIKALKEFGTGGKAKEKAAKALGIGRSTLYRKIEEFNIDLSQIGITDLKKRKMG